MPKKYSPFIRTIYLYLFALLGLVFLIVGAIRFIDMGLKVYVFTEAEKDQNYERTMFVPCSIEPEKLIERQDDKELTDKLTDEEISALKGWLAKYQEQEKIDYVRVQRHRDAATNSSFILVGLPLYLYHWSVIKKDRKEEEIKIGEKNNV
ncbi:hypothetical protein ACFLZ0_01460 [Patescibacteria group bacterium]